MVDLDSDTHIGQSVTLPGLYSIPHLQSRYSVCIAELCLRVQLAKPQCFSTHLARVNDISVEHLVAYIKYHKVH